MLASVPTCKGLESDRVRLLCRSLLRIEETYSEFRPHAARALATDECGIALVAGF